MSTVTKIELPSRFKFNRKLGTGRIGHVVLATDQELQREVAIKLIPFRTSHADSAATSVQGDVDTRRRARHEVDLACRLRHPSIVAAYDFFETRAAMGLVQQAVHGGDWTSDVTRKGERDQVERVRKLALAVDYIHEQGWAHGDIKPENVLVDLDGEPYLCDFGSARPLLDRDTAVGESEAVSRPIEINGTPAYMAPECASGRSPASVSADVYSMGMLLMDRLTGRCPFDGPPAAILDAVVHRGPPSLVSLGFYRNSRMQSIVDKATCRDPSHRYESAAAFAEDLSRYLENRPLVAKTSSFWERWRLWGKRNPMMRGLCGVFVSVLVSAILLVTANWRSANIQSKRLIQSEAQLIAESTSLRQSEEKLTALIDTLRRRQAAVQQAESLAIQLRNDAETTQLERVALIEKSKKLEEDANQKMHALQMSIAKTKAANIQLQSLNEQSNAEQSRLQNFTRQVAANESREAIDAAIASMNVSKWDEMERSLSAVHEDFRGFLYHHLALVAFHGSVTPRVLTFEVPIRAEKMVLSSDAATLAAFSREGQGVWINTARRRVLTLSAPEDIRRARPEVTAATISADGNQIAVAWDHRDSSQRIATYHLAEDQVQLVSDLALPHNANAFRFSGNKVYALVSSDDGKTIGLWDVQSDGFVWQLENEVADERQVLLLETQCDRDSTLAFAIFSFNPSQSLDIVCIDFRASASPPTVHTFELGTIDMEWKPASLFFCDGTAMGTVNEQGFSVEPASLLRRDMQAIVNRNHTMLVRWWRTADGTGVLASPLVPEPSADRDDGWMSMGKDHKYSVVFPDSMARCLVCFDRNGSKFVSVEESEDEGGAKLVPLHTLPLLRSIRHARGMFTADRTHFVEHSYHKIVVHPLQHRPIRHHVSVDDFVADLREFSERNDLDAILRRE
ncbi:serine/threonine protein kinase [Rhodopirellula maiorica SM1]|uniref:Serine/threonine protein kinase n=1 Tax=Rhodopirellula maiorica SM1 TaxID=1265738 RepID=M5RJL2_9BACT|nr:serine/threonine-protein kinase [Rhodopirellula maiorica]EMI19490.1 serine/threonine protein kinase [Rhodopirellula maiorica SM1]